jgi:hypothetical protein
MKNQLIGTDLYLRQGKGPIQHHRVWDALAFYAAREAEGEKAEPPYVVTLCEEADYRKEKWTKR